MAKDSKITLVIGSHGQYETTFELFDSLMAEYEVFDVFMLHTEIKELQGDPGYEVSDLTTRIECLMILAELRGLATN